MKEIKFVTFPKCKHLVTPRSKKSLSNFNFTTKNLKSLAKYGLLMLGNIDLFDCFYFTTVSLTFETTYFFFAVNLPGAALFVVGESFNCSDSWS